MTYLCSEMDYLRSLCLDKMQTYEKTLKSLLKEYKDEKETDVIALCVDIADTTKKYERIESLYYQVKDSNNIIITLDTILLLRSSELFSWIKFEEFEEEAYGCDL